MKKYEIKTDRFEFRFGTGKSSVPTMSEQEIFDAYLAESANCPVVQDSFDRIQDAVRAFEEDHWDEYGDTYYEQGSTFALLVGRVAWIEENEYDEDGEFIQGGNVWTFSAEPYEREEA